MKTYDGNTKVDFIRTLSEISYTDVALVGGKNASLGEMYQKLTKKGVNVPNGFAITSDAYWEIISANKLKPQLISILSKLDKVNYSNLKETGGAARKLIAKAVIPDSIIHDIIHAYDNLSNKYGKEISVAVRSSATAEDLPNASFAGQHDSFLNVVGVDELINACRNCYISLYNDRAIKYREDNGFDHSKVALSIGVQEMVRSDMASSGVIFTIEPESGFEDVILITGSWGLGENVVQGAVIPDEFYVFKPTYKLGKNSILSKKLGTKAKTMIYAERADHQLNVKTTNVDTPESKREQFILHDDEIKQLAGWSLIIENHYKQHMDIEWAKDGLRDELYIVQARPETVHKTEEHLKLKEYKIKSKGKILVQGSGVGGKIAKGVARILNSPSESDKLQKGEILITGITNPDWDPIMKKASAIVTNKGGRTSHAAIVARELGLVAVVGTNNATEVISNGQNITVSCLEGNTGTVYDGLLDWDEKVTDFRNIKMPKTHAMMIIADPEKAFQLSFYPNNGVGLLRMEFIINNEIQIHPMALVKYDELKDNNAKEKIDILTHHYPDKKEYFIDKLAQGVATIAAAFYPKDVIVRMSDFKTNEYANLIGGKEFEPKEENPMLGFRGASRYYNPRYKEGFKLECAAMKRVREDMGLSNVKLMIPFCRTVEEGKKVVSLMEENGLKRGVNGLEIYVMAEIPSNVILASEFAKVFDGFSIGSNDLTQLTLGIDRDSAIISELFDEKNDAPKQMIASVIKSAKEAGVKIGLCGQAPSDFPEFASFLVEQGIDSISFNPDALIKGIENINKAETIKNLKL